MSDGALPLSEGAVGQAVVDLQERLLAVGITPLTDVLGTFGPSTRAGVEKFQRLRGLRIDGVVGVTTWTTLVEAGLRLGDRLLYRTHPMLRGDDVAELQSRLCSLGFDTGRVDGIFGDHTAQALAEFQRNLQLPIDGTAGVATVSELVRVSGRHQTLEHVTAVRERELHRSGPPSLRGRHLGIGEIGGLSAISASLSRHLSSRGARVTLLHHPEESGQASEANAASVDVYVGLRLLPDQTVCTCSYYSSYTFESPAGKDLANRIANIVPQKLGIPALAQGMSLTVLRETRMPAVVLEFGPTELLVERGAHIVDVITDSLDRWAASTVENHQKP